MSTNPEWWPETASEWIELLMSVDHPYKAVRLEHLARDYARRPEGLEAQHYFEDLLDRSSSSDIELQAFIAIRNDERRRPPRVVEK